MHTRKLRDDAGFTVVEVVVAMGLSVVVLFAILTTLDTFSSHSARQTRVTDANAQVRTAMDRIVTDLRQAATVEVAGANDLVYTVVDSATQTRRERVCTDGAGVLWRSSVVTASPPAVPIAAGTACPTSGSGAFKITGLLSANSASNPIFRYDSATPASVRSVAVTIALNAGNVLNNDVSTLRASTFVRAKAETAPPVDISTSCNSSAQPTLTLSSSVGGLSVTYTDIDGNSLGSANADAGVLLTGGGGTVIANISSTTGIVSQIVKVISC
jgi:Tfp pilus assembly protein PilW